MNSAEMVGELMERLHPGCMVASAVVVVEVIAADSPPTAYVIWDEDGAPWCHEGLARLAVRKIEARTDASEAHD